MLEIRDASRALGLDLKGARLRPGDRVPDRPILALLHDGPHGHFVVVRPVGHTGRLVQVIDGRRFPAVMDAAVLVSSPEWSGLVLVPRGSSWPRRVAMIAALAVALAMAVSLMRRARLSRTPGRSPGATGDIATEAGRMCP
jgi:hypothetical protein